MHRQIIAALALLTERDSKARNAGYAKASEQMIAGFVAQLLKAFVPYQTSLKVSEIQIPEDAIGCELGEMRSSDLPLSNDAIQATNLIERSDYNNRRTLSFQVDMAHEEFMRSAAAPATLWLAGVDFSG